MRLERVLCIDTELGRGVDAVLVVGPGGLLVRSHVDRLVPSDWGDYDVS